MHALRPLTLAVVASLAVVAATPPSALAAPTYPDLGMARLKDFKIENTADGRRLLRFTTIIVNVGAGPFEVRGSRASTLVPTMTGHQCIYDASTCTLQSTAVTMGWSGDGHNHWHVVGLEEYELDRLDNGALVGTGAKTGFCFYDNTRHDLSLSGAPSSAVYTNCGASSNLSVTMGLSVGWGDTYYWNLAYQWVDITGLAAGRYRLWATADPENWFIEADDTNNFTWVDLQIRGKGSSVRVLGFGPSA